MLLRIVNADFYLHSPIQNLDPLYSEFRGNSIHQVPVLRIFGSTDKGIKSCLHIHGVFPYIYVPFDGHDSVESITYQLASSLDKAINISLGQTSSNKQHVFKVSLVSGIPFYGYHPKHHQFLKIYFYNPLISKKACSLLQNGNILGKIYQPHEAHIPYVLQFMIDYNLYGMSFINLSAVKYRIGCDVSDVPKHLILPPSVERMSVCKLEIDALAEHIQNREEVNSQNLGLNPGIQALWNDERQRRRNAGDSSTIENCLTQTRVNNKPTSTHLVFMNILNEKLRKPVAVNTEDTSQNDTVYPAETPKDIKNKIANASMIENHLDVGSQSSGSSFLDFTIAPEEANDDTTLTDDALKLLEVLNDLRENDEYDSILSQVVPKEDSDIEENEVDMSLPLGFVHVQTPPKNIQKNLEKHNEVEDAYFNLPVNIPQLDGSNDIAPVRRSQRLSNKRSPSGKVRLNTANTTSKGHKRDDLSVSNNQSPIVSLERLLESTIDGNESCMSKLQSDILNLFSTTVMQSSLIGDNLLRVQDASQKSSEQSRNSQVSNWDSTNDMNITIEESPKDNSCVSDTKAIISRKDPKFRKYKKRRKKSKSLSKKVLFTNFVSCSTLTNASNINVNEDSLQQINFESNEDGIVPNCSPREEPLQINLDDYAIMCEPINTDDTIDSLCSTDQNSNILSLSEGDFTIKKNVLGNIERIKRLKNGRIKIPIERVKVNGKHKSHVGRLRKYFYLEPSTLSDFTNTNNIISNTFRQEDAKVIIDFLSQNTHNIIGQNLTESENTKQEGLTGRNFENLPENVCVEHTTYNEQLMESVTKTSLEKQKNTKEGHCGVNNIICDNNISPLTLNDVGNETLNNLNANDNIKNSENNLINTALMKDTVFRDLPVLDCDSEPFHCEKLTSCQEKDALNVLKNNISLTKSKSINKENNQKKNTTNTIPSSVKCSKNMYIKSSNKNTKVVNTMQEINIFESDDQLQRIVQRKYIKARSKKNLNNHFQSANNNINKYCASTEKKVENASNQNKKRKLSNVGNSEHSTKKQNKLKNAPRTIPVTVHIPVLNNEFHKSNSTTRKTKKNVTGELFSRYENPKFVIVPAQNRPQYDNAKNPELSMIKNDFPNTDWSTVMDTVTCKYPPEKQIVIHSNKVFNNGLKIDCLPIGPTISHSTVFPSTHYSMKSFKEFEESVIEEFEDCYKTKENVYNANINFNEKTVDENIMHKGESNLQTEATIPKPNLTFDSSLCESANWIDTTDRDINVPSKSDITEICNRGKQITGPLINKAVNEDKILNMPRADITQARDSLCNTATSVDNTYNNYSLPRKDGKCDIPKICNNNMQTFDSLISNNEIKAVTAKDKLEVDVTDVLRQFDCPNTKEEFVLSLDQKRAIENFDVDIVHSRYREINNTSANIEVNPINAFDLKTPKFNEFRIWNFVQTESLKYNNGALDRIKSGDKKCTAVNMFQFEEKHDVDNRWQIMSHTNRPAFRGCPQPFKSINSYRGNVVTKYPVNQYKYMDGANDSSSSDEPPAERTTIKKRTKSAISQVTTKYIPLDVVHTSPTKAVTQKETTARIWSEDINSNDRVSPPKLTKAHKKHRRKLFSQNHTIHSTQIEEKLICKVTPRKNSKEIETIYVESNSNSSNSNKEENLPLQICEINLDFNRLLEETDPVLLLSEIKRNEKDGLVDLNKTITPADINSDSSTQLSDELFSNESDTNEDVKKDDPAEEYDVQNKFIPLAGSSKMDAQFKKLSQFNQSSSSNDIPTPYQTKTVVDDVKERELLLNIVSQNQSNKNKTTSLNSDTNKISNESILRNFVCSNLNKASVVITPTIHPPSAELVESSLAEFDIPEVEFQEPFYGDHKDVTGNVEVGRKVLKISSNNVTDLPTFKSNFGSIDFERQKMLQVLEDGNKKLTSKEILHYRLSTLNDCSIMITPGKLPPTQIEVQKWLEEEKQKVDDGKKEKNKPKKRLILINSPGRDSDESFDSLSLSPCTPIDANSTILKLDDNKFSLNNLDDHVDNTKLKNIVDSEKISPTLKEYSSIDKKQRKIQVQKARENLKSNTHYNYLYDTVTITSKDEPSVLTKSASAPLSENNAIVKNLASNRNSNSHQITGVNLDNTNNFLMGSHNLNDAKAIKESLHLTILSMEVIVITRNEYKPNPELDPIKAIIFTMHDNDKISNGGFIADSLPHSPSKVKLSILNGIDDRYNLTLVNSELELINKFVEFIRDCDPDIFIGFEIEMMSWGYLIDRGYILELNLTVLLSRTPNVTKKRRSDDEQGLNITGRILINFWRLLRHEIALTSYTFENIVYHILHQRIPLFSHKDFTYWIHHSSSIFRHRVIEHYSFKTNAVLQIIEKIDFIGRTSELAKLFGIQFYEVLSRGSQFRVESMMLRLAKPLNFIPVSPNQQQRARMRAPESLPLIMEPKSMFYTDHVIVLDFQSLYPSMMIAYNYCFSTCLGRIEHLGTTQLFEFGTTQLKVSRKYLKYFLKKDKLNISPCGVAFVNKSVRLGILPRMLQEILNTRLMIKKSLRENMGNKVLKRILDARQLGLKLIANVTYGYTAANFSGRMPLIELGDSVVSKGRETLQRAIHLVEKNLRWGAKVVYGDTDSLFVRIPGRSKETAFKIGVEIAEAVTNDNPSPVKLKLEKIFQPCILQTKKRYVGYMYESPYQTEPEFLAKGIETVRRDGCPAASKMLEKCLKLLFDTRDVSLVKKYVLRQFEKLLTGRVSIQDLIFAKEYRGASNYRPGACVPALELTKKWTSVDKRNEPRKGERVPYVIVNGAPGQPLIKLVRSPRDLLADPSLKPNALYYITKAIIPPINRCFLLIGADLHQWFKNMPRKQHQLLPTTSPEKNRTKKSTISQFFSTLDCAICGTLAQDGLCVKCKSKPQESGVLLHEKVRLWERNYYNTLLICHSCCDRQDEISCISLNCPIYYRRIQTSRDMQQSGYLRELVEFLSPDYF